jgi:hypothetical protein
MTLTKIKPFPQPMGVVVKVTDPQRKKMLMRLYPEYRRLCAFAQGSAQSSMFIGAKAALGVVKIGPIIESMLAD